MSLPSSTSYYNLPHPPPTLPPPQKQPATHSGYYEYPFHTLPDLGLVHRALNGFPLIGFGTRASLLTSEQIRFIANAYIWIQAHDSVHIPPSTNASYSELWFIIKFFEQLAHFRKASAAIAKDLIEKHGTTYIAPIANDLIEQHRTTYNAAIVQSQKHHYYCHPFDNIMHADFFSISAIIQKCAMVEAGSCSYDYYEYPFHTLPDLGLVDRAHFPQVDFGWHATLLSSEQIRAIASAYIWVQAHDSIRIPPSARASYSELWFFLQFFKKLANFRKASAAIGTYFIDQHRTTYNAAIAQKQHYHNYYPFDEIMRYNFYDIIAIIENCAIMEAELANVRQMYGNDSSSGSGVVGSSEERLVGVVSRRSTAAVAAKKRARQ
jgi:hypothetical protein